jgi:predicted ferric reductase
MSSKFLRPAWWILGAVNLAAVIFIWWTGSGGLLQSGGPSFYIALGRLFGLLGEFLILTELILIARIPWLEQAFGFDKQNKLHRYIGYGIAFFFIFHPLFLISGYAAVNSTGFISQFLNFLQNWEDVFNAFLGVSVFIAVLIFTIFWRKKVRYEIWHAVHLFMYLGIVLVFSHQTNNGDLTQGGPLWYWLTLNYAVFGVLIIYRFLRPLYLFSRHKFFVKELRQETHNVWSVIIGGVKMQEFKFRPGQFAFFYFLGKGYYEPHPFSFSAPHNGNTLRITPKASGDFTSKIQYLKPGTKVLIDGPLGGFTPDKAVKDKFLFIAGGIGITPLVSMANEMRDKDITLFYSVRTKDDLALLGDIPPRVKRHLFLSDGEGRDGFEKGIINEEKIRKFVADFKDRDVYICGPKQMMEDLTQMLLKMGVSKRQIHSEKFAF